MLSRLKIENFKLFKSLTLFRLPRFLLLGGQNNCGKTTVLESVFLPLNCLNAAMFLDLLHSRGLKKVPNHQEFLFATAYHNLDLNQTISFEYTLNSLKKHITYKFVPATEIPLTFSGKPSESINIPSTPEASLGGIKISYRQNEENPRQAFLRHYHTGAELKGINQEFEHFNNGVKMWFMPSTASSLSKHNAKQYGELDRMNKTDTLLKALQIMEPRLKSLSVIFSGDQPVLHGDTGRGKKIPLPLMGQGINKIMFILLGISHAQGGVALIDELENGFHYSFLPSLWKMIALHAKNNNTQIIATTHSRELIAAATEGLPQDLREEFQYTRIEKNEDQFKTKNYDFDTLTSALKTNLAIR